MAKKETTKAAPKAEAQHYTTYEKARLIGARALQISMGAPSSMKFTDADYAEMKYNPVEIAKREFEDGSIPIDVTRKLPE